MEKDRRYFTLPRKMVAAMTSESWERTPHGVFTQEADLQNLLAVLKNYNERSGEHITLNSALLKLVAECLKAAPMMNGHMRYRRLLVSGRITLFDHVDISVPVKFPGGMMIPVTLHRLEEKSIREIGADMADVMRRAGNTNMEEAMFDVSLHDTLDELKRFHLVKAIGRLIGALADRRHLRTLNAKERRAYRRIPESERLTRADLKQGTVTISNLGSLYREWKGACTMMEIVPPQLAAIGLGAVRDNLITLTIAFDHRGLDADDVFPFIRKMDEILADTEKLQQLL